MAQQDLENILVASWGGHAINDTTNYVSGIRGSSEWGLPDIAPAMVKRDGAWPILGGVDRPEKTITLALGITGTDLQTLRDQLLRWFDPEDETAQALIVTDEDGSRSRYVNAICKSIKPSGSAGKVKRTFVVTLSVTGDVRWRATSNTTDAWNITASGQTNVVNNPGTDDAYPIFEITPTAAKSGGYAYKHFIPITWRTNYVGTQYPVRIGPLDTTALRRAPLCYDSFPSDGALTTSATTGPDGQPCQARTWSGATWTVSGGKALNTPTLPTSGGPLDDGNLVTNGNFAAWTGDDPDGWSVTEVGDATSNVTENAGRCQLIRDPAGVHLTQVILTVGKWYRMTWDVDVASAAPNAIIYPNLNNYPITASGSYIFTFRATGTSVGFHGFNPCDILIDNASVKALTLAELINVPDLSVANVVAEIEIAVSPGGTQAGLAIGWDSQSSPANGILVYWDVSSAGDAKDIVVAKNVAGTWTEVARTATAFSANAKLVCVRDGSSVSVYYNNALIGATQTISDAAILAGTRHGMFSTNATPTMDNVLIMLPKVQADGDDLRVFDNGIEIDRWLVAMDSANTYIWVNLNFAPGVNATLQANIPASGAIASIEVGEDIYDMPDEGIVFIDDEVLTYTARDLFEEKLTGITRAAKGSSEAAHTTTDTVYWLQHDLILAYGNASATAPSVDNNYQAIFVLASSSNTSWLYQTFSDATGHRAGKWTPFGNITLSGYGGAYTATQRTLAAGEYTVAGAWLSELHGNAYGWQLLNPCGIVNADWADGFMRAVVVTDFLVHLMYWVRNESWWTWQATLADPVTPNNWEAWSEAAGAAWSKANTLAIANYFFASDVEVGTVTVTLSSDETPTVDMSACAEQGNYPLGCIIENTTTGESITVTFDMEVDGQLTVNTDEETVVYEVDSSNQFQSIGWSATRLHWLRLQPGNNTLKFTDVGTDTITVDTVFEARYY